MDGSGEKHRYILGISAYKPLLKFERILETYLEIAPRGLRSFLMAASFSRQLNAHG
jgi:hypothetical protein